MSSQGGSREDGRRLSMRTLAIASIASASAAVVTSLFWKGGTPIAAAVTPVVVAVVSEMLHRPAEKIASRFTAETNALPAEAAGGGVPPPAGAGSGQPPARAAGEPQMRVYRSAPRRPRLAFKPIAVTAAIAFVIAAAVLTLPELLTGQSLGQGDRKTTLFGGSGKDDSASSDEETPAPEQDDPAQPQPESDQPDDGRSAPDTETTPPEPPAERAPPTTSPAPAAPGEPVP